MVSIVIIGGSSPVLNNVTSDIYPNAYYISCIIRNKETESQCISCNHLEDQDQINVSSLNFDYDDSLL